MHSISPSVFERIDTPRDGVGPTGPCSGAGSPSGQVCESYLFLLVPVR